MKIVDGAGVGAAEIAADIEGDEAFGMVFRDLRLERFGVHGVVVLHGDFAEQPLACARKSQGFLNGRMRFLGRIGGEIAASADGNAIARHDDGGKIPHAAAGDHDAERLLAETGKPRKGAGDAFFRGEIADALEITGAERRIHRKEQIRRVAYVLDGRGNKRKGALVFHVNAIRENVLCKMKDDLIDGCAFFVDREFREHVARAFVGMRDDAVAVDVVELVERFRHECQEIFFVHRSSFVIRCLYESKSLSSVYPTLREEKRRASRFSFLF